MKPLKCDVRMQFCSVEAAAWAMGVPVSVVAKWVRRGRIPVARRRGRVVVPVAVVVRLLGEPVGVPR